MLRSHFPILRFLALTLAAGALLGCSGPVPATQFDCDGGCGPVCAVAGQTCSDVMSCCPGLGCANGTCACGARDDACGPGSAPCCGGLACDDATGQCRPPCTLPKGACQPLSGPCTTGADCCAPGLCTNGTCADPSTQITCKLGGEACATTSDCCGAAAFGSQLECLPGSDGGLRCHLGQSGEACDPTHHCTPGLTCILPAAPDAGTPPDAGSSDAGSSDAGSSDAGGLDSGLADDGGADAGAADDGGADAGAIDAGTIDAGTIDAGVFDAGTSGICGIVKSGKSCTLYSATCGGGDVCNPSSSTNQGYDPCYLKVVSNSLAYRSPILVCNAGFCSDPGEGSACTSKCIQTPGDSRKTSCLTFSDGSKQCMPSCSSDTDCRGATYYDGQLANPTPVTNYCVNYGNGAGCQPSLCFIEGQAGAGDAGLLYQPCDGKPDTQCQPRFVGADSTILGYCMAVRATTKSTVGEVCDVNAGREATLAVCGKDAYCLAGRCAALCDAALTPGTPACDKESTCISAQGLDLIADYQVGGCATACDPFADLEHSGCVNYCGGPGARCTWLIGDQLVNQPRGYCSPSAKVPLKPGDYCSRAGIDACQAGSMCLGSTDPTCYRLCDPTASSGPDTCPTPQTCLVFQGFKKSGYCR